MDDVGPVRQQAAWRGEVLPKPVSAIVGRLHGGELLLHLEDVLLESYGADALLPGRDPARTSCERRRRGRCRGRARPALASLGQPCPGLVALTPELGVVVARGLPARRRLFGGREPGRDVPDDLLVGAARAAAARPGVVDLLGAAA